MMNRRGFMAALTGAAAAIGLIKPKDSEQVFVEECIATAGKFGFTSQADFERMCKVVQAGGISRNELRRLNNT